MMKRGGGDAIETNSLVIVVESHSRLRINLVRTNCLLLARVEFLSFPSQTTDLLYLVLFE